MKNPQNTASMQVKIDADLYAKARAKMDREGLSVRDVTEWSLERFVAQKRRVIKHRAA